MSGRRTPSFLLTGKNCPRASKILRDTIQGITEPVIRRLARRGGISGLIQLDSRRALDLPREHHSRLGKSVTALDVVHAPACPQCRLSPPYKASPLIVGAWTFAFVRAAEIFAAALIRFDISRRHVPFRPSFLPTCT
ncbi:hypothetical protein C8R47DRAFT_255533 [Mycena vitilis]|nr:hypothetical protein C8R47DRAFT_255533 [Mycena vitilis]